MVDLYNKDQKNGTIVVISSQIWSKQQSK